MTYEDVRNKIRDGAYTPKEVNVALYPSNHIFDRTKSVDWNEAEVRRKNSEIRDMKADVEKQRQVLFGLFQCDLVNVIAKSCLGDVKLNLAQAQIVFEMATDEWHGSNLGEIIGYSERYAEYALHLLNAVDKVGKANATEV